MGMNHRTKSPRSAARRDAVLRHRAATTGRLWGRRGTSVVTPIATATGTVSDWLGISAISPTSEAEAASQAAVEWFKGEFHKANHAGLVSTATAVEDNSNSTFGSSACNADLLQH